MRTEAADGIIPNSIREEKKSLVTFTPESSHLKLKLRGRARLSEDQTGASPSSYAATKTQSHIYWPENVCLIILLQEIILTCFRSISKTNNAANIRVFMLRGVRSCKNVLR